MSLTKARQRYSAQRSSAKRRNIMFNISFEDWYNWWLNHGVDKNISNGPLSKNTLCMCRKGDQGAYDLTNIYCDTVSNNSNRPGSNNPMFGRKGKNQFSV